MSSSALPAISVRPPSSDQPDNGESGPSMLTPAIAYSQPPAPIAERKRLSRQSLVMEMPMDPNNTKPLPRIPRKPSNRTSIPIPELSAPSSISLDSNTSSTPTTHTGDTSTEDTSQSQTPISSSPSLLDNAPAVAPPLSRVHFACYQYHRTLVPSRNTYYPLPCMTCLRTDDKNAPRFRCTFCCLRICGDCVKGLQRCERRSLMVFMEELVRMLEGGGEGEKEA